MHRSHIDYLLISYIFYVKNITFPHVCAGINLNFWPVGRIIRKGGGFFIRRSFSGNKVYKESLYAYLKALLSSKHCIEFFIEGTRSRTGKLLLPKMGILNLLLRAYAEGAAQDILFVPVAINYDHIPEQKTYQSESSGAEKSRENAGELLEARKALGRKYGKIYLQFGDPVSLHGHLEGLGIPTLDAAALKKETNDFAYHLTYNINRMAIVTPIALVSLALLTDGSKTITMPTLLTRIALFKGYLDHKGAVYTDVIHFNLHWAAAEALKTLKSRNLIKEAQTFEETFFTIEDAHRSDLDYYKNNILHFFVSLTCCLKILKAAGTAPITLDQAVKQYEMFKTLFRHDFIFSARASIKEHLTRVLEYCHNKGFLVFNREAQTFIPTLTTANTLEFSDLQGLLDNFLESHLIMLRYLRHNTFTALERKVLIKDILLKAQNIFLKGDLCHPEALSHFNLENSLKVFTDIGILKTEVKDKDRAVYTNRNEVELIETWISSLRGFLSPAGAVPSVVIVPAAAGDQATTPELH
jgi:glycerol-3-phosphate O-acyltransferase